MEDNADLELLTSLLEENEAAESSDSHFSDASNGPDAFNELFDGDEEGSYHESDGACEEQDSQVKEDFNTLFGDIDDLEDDKPALPNNTQSPSPTQEKSKKELEEELQKMQQQMRRLQEQLQHTGIAQSPSAALPRKSAAKNMRITAPKSQCSLLKERNYKPMQESSTFADQLVVPSTSSMKHQDTAKRKLPMSENNSPPQKKIPILSPVGKSVAKTSPAAKASPQPAPSRPSSSQQMSFEKFSGLRLRKPRVSSLEMERKMGGRKMIKLFQLQSKITTEKLEDQDWVTFGVIVKKVTPQSSNNGKTFSIWRLNDLKNFDTCVSLFLFGDVHKEHWKTDQGVAIGILNASLMKPKDGSEEVCLSVDNPQKILLLGEAMDLGTCKARKKNGDPCTQMVNVNDCEFCQYHVQAQYKKVSAKRADLQSSYSGHVPKKMTTKGGNSLKEKLCHSGFHYGGVSSMAYGASLASATAPKKSVQTTLSNMVVRGAGAITLEAKQKMAAAKKNTVQCSDEFKELLTVPTPGALNLNRHLSGLNPKGTTANPGSCIQSLSASELLKQQRKQLLDARKRKSEETQKRFLESTNDTEQSSSTTSAVQAIFQSPKQAAEFPRAQKISAPKLGRGVTEGEDVVFFDVSPPSCKLKASAEAKKIAAFRKLQAKGQVLTKENPNGIKRKRSSAMDIDQVAERVDRDVTSPEADDEEPVMKKHKEQLAYLQSEEFQKILNAKSKHTGVLKEAEADLQEQYFEPLVKKEQLEEKMRGIREQKCRAVTCKTCKYTHYKPLDTCVSENHDFHWHDAVKRFFKCPCGNRTISLDRLPKKPCSTCGVFKWERDGMLKEKRGPKIGGELLLTRGEEHGKFLNSR
ncbi:protein MCM10 homolog [Rana temporaria]|uniref:protein MCM10 homolog n=1 Tax=Rana temporaria TaxID=8407 RepID=UPI001AAD5ECB|nr:protein MCM10 homolog [Rana temporaria]